MGRRMDGILGQAQSIDGFIIPQLWMGGHISCSFIARFWNNIHTYSHDQTDSKRKSQQEQQAISQDSQVERVNCAYCMTVQWMTSLHVFLGMTKMGGWTDRRVAEISMYAWISGWGNYIAVHTYSV